MSDFEAYRKEGMRKRSSTTPTKCEHPYKLDSEDYRLMFTLTYYLTICSDSGWTVIQGGIPPSPIERIY
jgi:hypothetical protein